MTERNKMLYGITTLVETYETMKKLDFSNDILKDIENMVDELMFLVNDKSTRDFLVSHLGIKYDTEKTRYFIDM